MPFSDLAAAAGFGFIVPPCREHPADITMWKSFLLAGGIFACLVGVEMLLIDSAVVVPLGGGGASTFRAPDWVPWTLLSVGAATVLQFCHLPRSSPPAHHPHR
jgi:hypothetical protein